MPRLIRHIPSYLRQAEARQDDLFSARQRCDDIPSDFLLKNLKEKRKFRFLSRKLGVFMTFVGIYIAVLLLDRNISGRAIVQHIIAREILETSKAPSGITYQGIHDTATFWDWVENSFFPIVYATEYDDGTPKPDELLYTIASHTKIVGGFHIYQKRYERVTNSTPGYLEDPCYSKTYSALNLTCLSGTLESNAVYGPAAAYIRNVTNTANSTNNNNTTDATNTTTTTTTTIVEIPKEVEMFQYNETIDGFQTFFLRSTTKGQYEKAKLTKMKTAQWIDLQTKSIEIVMPMYNANVKVWSVIHLTIEFDLAGGIMTESFIHVTNIEPYDWNNNKNFVRSILEIIFVVHVAYFILLEIWDICVLCNGSIFIYIKRYGGWNNLGDWANICINVAIIFWRFFCQANSTRLHMLKLTTFDEYVPALSLAILDDILLAMNIFNVLLLTARALKYFQVTDGGRRLMQSVYGAMPEVMSFLPIYFAVIIGYTFAGHMLYGLEFDEWSTWPSSLFRVFQLNFGLYDPSAIYDANGYLSVVFIYSSNIVFCILMLNVFMAIVMSTWEALAQKELERKKDHAKYTRQLGLKDLFWIVFMREDIMDELINIGMDLDKSNGLVNKDLFLKACLENPPQIPPKVLARVVSWYWGENSTSPSFLSPRNQKKLFSKVLPKYEKDSDKVDSDDDGTTQDATKELQVKGTTSSSDPIVSIGRRLSTLRPHFSISASPSNIKIAVEADSSESPVHPGHGPKVVLSPIHPEAKPTEPMDTSKDSIVSTTTVAVPVAENNGVENFTHVESPQDYNAAAQVPPLSGSIVDRIKHIPTSQVATPSLTSTTTATTTAPLTEPPKFTMPKISGPPIASVNTKVLGIPPITTASSPVVAATRLTTSSSNSSSPVTAATTKSTDIKVGRLM